MTAILADDIWHDISGQVRGRIVSARLRGEVLTGAFPALFVTMRFGARGIGGELARHSVEKPINGDDWFFR